MPGLGNDPRVQQLARSLGLPARGDVLPHLRRLATERIDRIVAEWAEPIRTLDDLLRIVAGRLSVCIERIGGDADVARIARTRAAYVPHLAELLQCEFIAGKTEGLLIEHQDPRPGDRRYLVVIDARGERAVRAFFTTWHEIAHVITTPPQLELKLLRRTLNEDGRPKDPTESAVDYLAGAIAFYQPIFGPALDRALRECSGLTFEAVERARDAVAPNASTFAACVAAVRSVEEPACFVRAEARLKPAEQRRLRSAQFTLGALFEEPTPNPKLRLVDVVANDAARCVGLRLHEHLRVPPTSVLFDVQELGTAPERCGSEDQRQWETSAHGSLEPLPLLVNAARRGTSVYGLIRCSLC
jgi:hypothetical protein